MKYFFCLHLKKRLHKMGKMVFSGATMKKIFITGSALLLWALGTSQVSAQNYSYSQDRIAQGYGSATTLYEQNHSAETPTYPAPSSAQSYGFYLNQKPQTSGQLIWYPTARQRAQGFGMPPYDQTGYNPQANTASPYRSPVYQQEQSRSRVFYVGTNIGLGNTLGWKGTIDHPIVPIWNITFGKRFNSNVRADAEFQYHSQAKLANSATMKVNYSQYDLGANIYYDFPVATPYRPFIGIGVWGIKGKLSGRYQLIKRLSANSSVKFALSVAAGLSYKMSETFSLIAMLRSRYIFTKDDLYNLEGLLGVQYHF